MKSQLIKDLITQAEAARIRGVTIAAIGDLIKRGRLSVVEVAGIKLLRRSEVMNFKNILAGRPKKSESEKVEKKTEISKQKSNSTKKGTFAKKTGKKK